jgi:hypothetical protein
LIGSIRREGLDYFIVSVEAHLRRILRAYYRYYNDIRTHRSLDKDAPVSRPIQRTGIISSRSILGGLHHHYLRVYFSVHTRFIYVASGDLQNQELRQILYRVKGLEPMSPNVPGAAAENQYRDENDQKSGGVHMVLMGNIRDWIRHLQL